MSDNIPEIENVDQQEQKMHRNLKPPLEQLGHLGTSTQPEIQKPPTFIEELKQLGVDTKEYAEATLKGESLATGDRVVRENTSPINLALERLKRMRTQKKAA